MVLGSLQATLFGEWMDGFLCASGLLCKCGCFFVRLVSVDLLLGAVDELDTVVVVDDVVTFVVAVSVAETLAVVIC